MRRVILLSAILFAGPWGEARVASADDDSSALFNCRSEYIWPRIEANYRVAPEFPRSGLNRSTDGWVLLNFEILPNGQTDNISVLDAYPDGVFDSSAIKALKKWSYPTRKDASESIQSRVVMTYDYDYERPTRDSITSVLSQARDIGFRKGDLDSAEGLLDKLSEIEPFRMFEFMVIEQTYGLIAYAKNDHQSAIKHLFRSSLADIGRDNDVADLTDQFFIKALVAAEEYCSAVLLFESWEPAKERGRAAYEDMSPTMAQIRSALEAGRPIEMN